MIDSKRIMVKKEEFLEKYFRRLDLTKTPEKTGIHFEQKITPDLLWCVAQAILSIIESNDSKVFSDKEIRTSQVFDSLMRDYFSKPGQEKDTENEYNKVSSYQLGLLTYSCVLKQVGQRPKQYQVEEMEILKFIASNELNSIKFLGLYVDKFLKDNKLLEIFKNYKEQPILSNYIKAKVEYLNWARANTKVKGLDPRHSYRVFNKIFNIFAYTHRLPGELKARVIRGICPYFFLVYNQPNFRDVRKPPGMSRRAFYRLFIKEASKRVQLQIRVRHAKQEVKEKHQGSEVQESKWGYEKDVGMAAHRILMESEYPEFASFRENVIVLTPGQHFSFAHPRGNTQIVDEKFQLVCLLAKLKSIEHSINKKDSFYKLKNLILILNKRFNWNLNQKTNIKAIRKKLKSKIALLN